MNIKTGLGQDSHRFDEKKQKPFILGGIEIDFDKSLSGNSDADVVLHAITNAISSISGQNIIGERSDYLCKKKGITDSSVYLKEALDTLNYGRISNIAIAIECLKPRLSGHIDKMKKKIAELLNMNSRDIGITVTSGEGLTEFGRGNGIQAFVTLTHISE